MRSWPTYLTCTLPTTRWPPFSGCTASICLITAKERRMRQLIWFRTDLRVRDNTALHAALQAGPTLAVFLLSPGQWLAHDDAPCKVDFWLRNLRELQAELQQLNVPLLIRHAEHWHDAPAVLAGLCRELKIGSVQVNEEYGLNEARRDQQVAQQLETLSVVFHSHMDRLLFK